MMVVGLTGGIASGKSTVAQLFAQHGIPIIDADAIAREVVQPYTEGWQALTTYFGDVILDENQQIRRSKLKNIIFNDNNKRQWLEKTLHPLIRKTIQQRLLALSDQAYVIVVIPLLVENLPNTLVDRILVVDCEEKIQMHRLMQRDNIGKKEAEKILSTQASRDTRLKHADDVISNNLDPLLLATKVEEYHEDYLGMAGK